MSPPAIRSAQHRLAPDLRGGRICARPGGAGRAQAGSQTNRQGSQVIPAPGLTRGLAFTPPKPEAIASGAALGRSKKPERLQPHGPRLPARLAGAFAPAQAGTPRAQPSGSAPAPLACACAPANRPGQRSTGPLPSGPRTPFVKIALLRQYNPLKSLHLKSVPSWDTQPEARP